MLKGIRYLEEWNAIWWIEDLFKTKFYPDCHFCQVVANKVSKIQLRKITDTVYKFKRKRLYKLKFFFCNFLKGGEV